MKRTQIQLPDWLFTAAREAAERKEISLAELVRRGLEYMVAVTPGAPLRNRKWELPDAHALAACDPFSEPDWRERLHIDRSLVAESREEYGPGNES
jgi:hypothetical protein